MTDEKCIRCGWPIVNDPAKGCTTEKCRCTCEAYPKCGCGMFDGRHTPVIEDPVLIPLGGGQPIPLPQSDSQTFVLMNYPSDAKGDVVYIGSDKAKAFDKLMKYGNENYCQVCDLKIVKETE